MIGMSDSLGVDYDDIVEMAIACVHVDSVALRSCGAMDVGVCHEYLISFHDPECLEVAVTDHQEVERDFAGTGAIDSSAHGIAIKDQVIHHAAVAYPFRNVVVVEVYDMLHGFGGENDSSSEINLYIIGGVCHYCHRYGISFPLMSDQLAIVSQAVIEGFLEALSVICDAVTDASE